MENGRWEDEMGRASLGATAATTYLTMIAVLADFFLGKNSKWDVFNTPHRWGVELQALVDAEVQLSDSGRKVQRQAEALLYARGALACG
jgi:hypothetical protein